LSSFIRDIMDTSKPPYLDRHLKNVPS
jgi:hypothetical protein